MNNKASKEACTIARYINDWILRYVPTIRNCSECTIKRYKVTISLYLSFLEQEMKVTQSSFSFRHFEQVFIEQWIEWLKNVRHNSPATCNLRLSTIRAFLDYLGTRDKTYLYLSTEVRNINNQKVAKRKVSGISENAVKVLMNMPNRKTKTGRRDLTLFTIMYGTAARLNEVLSIRLEDVHLEGKKPFISVIGKGSKNRPLYLLPKAVTHLKTFIRGWHADFDKKHILFYSVSKGMNAKISQTAVDKQLKKYAKLAHQLDESIPENLHCHQLRHAKAQHWLDHGINIVEISKMLGHESVETTMIYLDITIEQVKNALVTIVDDCDEKECKKWIENKGKLITLCNF